MSAARVVTAIQFVAAQLYYGPWMQSSHTLANCGKRFTMCHKYDTGFLNTEDLYHQKELRRLTLQGVA